jgi:ParB/RepB/Spo0J family partition protein
MRKIKYGTISLKDIKKTEDSRLREKADVSDLMHDIEQRGLLEPVGIRKQDNALIYGNRRVKAFENLGYKEIDCIFFGDVSDDDLLISNVAENIKRKDIGSIEIGRIVDILTKRGLSDNEIAERFGITKGRVQRTLSCYKHLKGTPFEQLAVYGSYGAATQRKGIPESLVWQIEMALQKSKRNATKDEWNILLVGAEQGLINSTNISTFRYILLAEPDIDIEKALKYLINSKVTYATFVLDRKTLAKEIQKTKFQVILN